MTRQQWIAVGLIIFVVILAIVIGLIVWNSQKKVVVVEPQVATLTPIVAGKAMPTLAHIRKVNNQPNSTGATYREVKGKQA